MPWRVFCFSVEYIPESLDNPLTPSWVAQTGGGVCVFEDPFLARWQPEQAIWGIPVKGRLAMRKSAALTAIAAFLMAFAFGSPANAEFSFPFDGDLAGHWSFDTNTGSADALDDSVNSNDGKLFNSATRSTDIPDTVGNVKSLDLTQGANAFVTLGDPSELQFTSGDLTIAAWVKPTATNTIDHIFARRDPACSATIGYILVLQADNEMTFRDAVLDRESDFLVPDGQWSFIAVVFHSGATPTVDLFVNGSSNLGVTAAGLGTPANADIQIGQANGCAPSSHFDGKIDEVRVFDIALTPEEIAELRGAPERD